MSTPSDRAPDGSPLSLPDAVDRLFDGSLSDFVSRRNTLAKQLRQAGQKSDADAVKKLTKPATPAWLVDRWARRHPGLIERLIGVVDALRTTQLAASPDRERMLQLRDEERDILAALEAVSVHLGEKGPPSASTIERALKTARAAAAQPDRLEALKRGHLVQEVIVQGFEGLSDLLSSVDVAAVQTRREATERARLARQMPKVPGAIPREARPAALSVSPQPPPTSWPTKEPTTSPPSICDPNADVASSASDIVRLQREVSELKEVIAQHTAALADAESRLARTYAELSQARAALARDDS
ncbi:MAG: hypothetical protein AAFN74_01120 [Myxococcota bacterium]